MNTTYFLDQVMGNVFHTKPNPALPAAYYIGLSSTEPANGVCTGEPSRSGTGYTRVQLTSLSTPTKGVIKNTQVITFAESLKSWGDMKYYVVYDAAENGNLLFYGALTQSRNVEPNTVISIRVGELKIMLEPPAAT